jgi:thiamine-phosphate pyrophosphorylase
MLTLERTMPHGKRGPPLPTVFFVTDPARTLDPVGVAERLPRGSGVIFRGFGLSDQEGVAEGLARTARRRGLILLIGADEALAARVDAAGVHLPERDIWKAPAIRRRHPGWLITGAAHSASALRKAHRAGLDAVLLSTAFASHSPTAGAPLGPVRLAFMAQSVRIPVVALGGMNGVTARRLIGTGVAGFAAVEGLL